MTKLKGSGFVLGRFITCDVMIFKIFSQKKIAKNWRYLLQTMLGYAHFLSQHWILRKTPIFSPKIVKNRRIL
jgi:hypothetical protein